MSPESLTIAEVADLIRDLIIAQTERESLLAAQEKEVTAIKEKFASKLGDAETKAKILEETIFAFMDTHPAVFEDRPSVLIDTSRIGYTPGKWKVELTHTEEETIALLEAIKAKGERENASNKAAARAERAAFLLRTKIELDKKRIVEESARPEVLEFLGEVGIWLSKTDRPFIKPDRQGQKPKDVSSN